MDLEKEFKKELDVIIRNLLIKEKIAVIGAIVCSTDISFTTEKEAETINTMCTNGDYIKINPIFWSKLSKQDKIYCLAHQLWHIALLHPIRATNKDPKFFRIAADVVVANILDDSGFKTDKIKVATVSSLKDHSTEDIYDKLMLGDIKPPPEDKDDIGNDLEFSNKLSDEEQKEFEREIKSKLAGFGSMSGDLPGEVKDIISDFLKPRIKFGNILKRFLTNLGEESRTYQRPNHRLDNDNLILATTTEDLGKLTHINFYIDSSGSVSDEEIVVFNSEIKQIKELYNPETLSVITFDTKIITEHTFSQKDKYDYIEIVGRGGTDFDCVFEHITNNKPTVAIICTDLDIHRIPDKPKNTEIAWLCTVLNPRTTPTFGKLIYVDIGAYNE
jgi:predicted metal-dependent peptidase